MDSQPVNIDRELDLTGEVCPHTYVKSKLAIEGMKPAETLRVIVDHAPATINVPRNMENEGHQVLSVHKINETHWEMIIKKGSR